MAQAVIKRCEKFIVVVGCGIGQFRAGQEIEKRILVLIKAGALSLKRVQRVYVENG